MRVICVGEMLVDILAYPVDNVPFDNNACMVDDIKFTSGGDANNNAVDFSKLGNSVVYMGLIGCDFMGEFAIQQAEKAGIDMSHAARSKEICQPKSLILLNSVGERTFIQCKGTSSEFSIKDCDLSLFGNADLLQIGGTFHLPKFDGEDATQLLKYAQQKNVITSMDVTTDHTGMWNEIIKPCYPYLDYFLPSIEQASLIAKSNVPEEIADFFLNQGVKNIVVKLGSRGSFFKNSNTSFYAGTYLVPVVETTGAGDAFCAGFLTGVGENLSPEECVILGTACSAFVIQEYGATTGIKDLNTIKKFIMSNSPIEIRKI